MSPTFSGTVRGGIPRSRYSGENTAKPNLKLPELKRHNSYGFKLQSATDDPLQSAETQKEVVTFVDANRGDHTDFKLSNDPIDAYKVDSTLGEYLSRPVNIFSQFWAENSNIDVTFDPWALF